MADQTPAQRGVAPYLTVDGAAAAIDFYKRAFAAEELSRQEAPGSDKLMHAALLINGGMVMLADDFGGMEGAGQAGNPKALGGTPVTLHIERDEVDSLWNAAIAAGATVAMPLEEMFWGSRYGILEDPFGHRWSLGTPQKPMSDEELRRGAEQAMPPQH